MEMTTEKKVGLYRVVEQVRRKYEVWAPRYHQVFWSLEDAARHIPPVGPARILTEGAREVARYMDGQMTDGFVYSSGERQ